MSANTQPKTNNQVRAIFGEGKKCGLDQEAIRDVVESTTGRTRSISALTHAEAQAVIRKLKGSSFVALRTVQHRRQKQGVTQLVAPAQLQLIADLASQRHWSAETLVKFCKRQCGHEHPRTTRDANKVIEALKAMNKRDQLWSN